MNKDELRKHYLAKRISLTEREHRALNEKIVERFFHDVELSSIKILHLFLPIESKRELNTWPIIERLQKTLPHIQLVLPRVRENEMDSILFEGPTQLIKTKWGMVEPKEGKPVNPWDIDLILVPLLAVDKQGHRVGYGKGFYDRFLKSCRPDCIKVGVSFFEPEALIQEKLEADVILNRCITPTKTHQF